ncbi:MAG: ATP-binding cassette domain-containing protein [Acidimicrobiia bacterium]
MLNIEQMRLDLGQVIAVTGPSGSGKTTLLQLIGGLLHPQRGTIEGRPPPETIRWVFQTPTVLGRRTVLDNLLLGLHQRRLDTPTAAATARQALVAIGLGQLASRAAGSLSGGETQRVQIARALVGRPPLVLADEPTGQLDRSNTEQVIASLAALSTSDSTVVVASHDPLVAEACDRRFELRDGRAIEV